MPFDGVVTRAITNELTSLQGGRIQKIYQPTDSELILTVRSGGKNHSLLISTHSSYARIHLTNEKYTNPKEPPMFCMVLRKYLGAGFIESVEQVELERIIHIKVRSKDEIGDEQSKTLIIELMGKHSNVMVVDPERNVILDSLKHISPAQNRHRTILPGQTYIAPPEQGKLNPLELDGDTFVRKLDFLQGKIDRQMLNLLMGCSPLVTKALASEAYLGDNQAYADVFETFKDHLINHHYEPKRAIGQQEDFHVLPEVTFDQETKTFDSISGMLDDYYAGKAERDRIKNQTHDLMRFLKNEKAKNERKIKKQEKTLAKAEQAEDYQKYGELLTAHLHLVKLGDETVDVMDYYDPEQKTITLELDPNKSPSDNAQYYFKQYQKLKKSKEVVLVEIEKAKQEIDYFERLIQQLEQARQDDVQDMREELEEEGYLKAKQQKSKKKKQKWLQPDHYQASDGTELIVGRNNKQNEFVTNRMANKNDIWLHTKDIPGSHVIIRHSDPSDETILEAAMIAAYYSKAKHSSTVPVDYTAIKHVRKPNGAKPGYVTYDNQQTVYVTPDERQIEQMKVTEDQPT
ncbi:Rqc2 family fibronectin-binding protein [Alkalibacillus almallahensis]|uniref:Rqc2 family fibronectin-binding protein n=1 Tax=Alkalibacillus almallahensis TaxID=1379154 RepID=UPI00141D9855|nr:NFACT RNA binding domain-containing protein [Alkalibacillus almallahensis]NIK10729.1 putative ribosome quality control (RQC) complex YloA/Tae2 family protein [Alkalibacillus almallahensis]